jgi:small subunit ribosomal protein S6e
MKLHIGNPFTGCNAVIAIDDDNKLRCFYDKKVAQEIAADSLGPEFKGYVFRIIGGTDKSGFPMKQGVLTNSKVSLLIHRGTIGYQKWRGKKGVRRRKTVRGCIIGPDIAALNLTVVKKGDQDIAGLTDTTKPRTLGILINKKIGPKRATKIRKLFKLSKEDDVRKFVIKHKHVSKKTGKETLRAPKIQRLLTPQRLRRQKLVIKRGKERKERRDSAKKRFEKSEEKKKQLLEKKKETTDKKE